MTRLTTAQLELQVSARDLATNVFLPTAAETDRTEAYPWDNIAALRDAGFMGMTIPEAYGGRGLSYMDTVLVIEEMARACSTMGRITVEANMGAIGAVMKYGS
ncbi:MAG: acyl-CoA dehydrogenase family protein, partial [Alphaproteobacteria bacterium]